MNDKSKKAFTLVELVIVIAVIAILAAVLIPIFSDLTKKTEVSVDCQNTVNMNKILLSEETLTGKPDSYSAARAVLEKNGFVIPINAKNSDSIFIWDAELNKVFLYNLKTAKADFPEDVAAVLKNENIMPSGTGRWYSLNKSFNKENWDEEEIKSGAVYDGTSLVKVTDETLDEYTVKDGTTEICADAFWGCRNMKKVIIPDSVRIISNRAFYYCYSLENVIFGKNSNLAEIRESAFEGCSALTAIDLPDSLLRIERMVFGDCKKLKRVNFGEQSRLTYMGEYIFKGCESMIVAEIPGKVKSVGENIFYGCENLYKIINNSDLTFKVGNYRNRQPKLVVNKSGTVCLDGFFEYEDFIYEKKADGSLLMRAYSGNANRVVLPESCDGKPYEIYELRGVGEVEIPDSFKFIGEKAFSGCNSLSRVYFSDGSQLSAIGSQAFLNCVNLTEFNVPEYVSVIGDNAFYGCNKLLTVTNKSTLNIVAKSSDNGYIAYYAETVN